jgi:hypothetical protein
MRKIRPMQLALLSGTGNCMVTPTGRARVRPAPQPFGRAAA